MSIAVGAVVSVGVFSGVCVAVPVSGKGVCVAVAVGASVSVAANSKGTSVPVSSCPSMGKCKKVSGVAITLPGSS